MPVPPSRLEPYCEIHWYRGDDELPERLDYDVISGGILWLVYRAIRGIVRGIGRRWDEQRDLDILDAAIERGRIYDGARFSAGRRNAS